VKRILAVAFVVLVALAAFGDEKEKEPTVDLDVKDEDVIVILYTLKEQCGIRNMLIDKNVGGRAMFYFRDVPCTTAFDVVARTMGLAYEIEPNSVVGVHRR